MTRGKPMPFTYLFAMHRASAQDDKINNSGYEHFVIIYYSLAKLVL
jgi:hypothetical protein